MGNTEAMFSGDNPVTDAQVWHAAEELRGDMDLIAYKSLVHSLLLLRHFTDTTAGTAEYRQPGRAGEARWSHLQTQAGQTTIANNVVEALADFGRSMPEIQDTWPTDFDPARLEKCRLGELIDLISSIPLMDESGNASGLLGQVIEYTFTDVADGETAGCGQFNASSAVMQMLKGRTYDPCCGSGGMFSQSQALLEQI